MAARFRTSPRRVLAFTMLGAIVLTTAVVLIAGDVLAASELPEAARMIRESDSSGRSEVSFEVDEPALSAWMPGNLRLQGGDDLTMLQVWRCGALYVGAADGCTEMVHVSSVQLTPFEDSEVPVDDRREVRRIQACGAAGREELEAARAVLEGCYAAYPQQ